jgi:hypothetical protein
MSAVRNIAARLRVKRGVKLLSEAFCSTDGGVEVYHAHVVLEGKEYIVSVVPTDLDRPAEDP